ncbi:hypothetical protein Q3G72_016501 [Acer saccharum]|nr:hypothetical protein Q3G72_016501 [Acer saccharum]
MAHQLRIKLKKGHVTHSYTESLGPAFQSVTFEPGFNLLFKGHVSPPPLPLICLSLCLLRHYQSPYRISESRVSSFNQDPDFYSPLDHLKKQNPLIFRRNYRPTTTEKCLLHHIEEKID